MKIVTNQEMREIENIAINDYKIPSIIMMENAARSVLDEITKLEFKFRRIVILCGIGENGGQGFSLARQLINNDIKVVVIVVGDRKKIQGDSLINLEILKSNGIKIDSINDVGGVQKLVNVVDEDDIIVDAIFGIELQETIKDIPKRVIETINEMNNFKISVDIPSGVNGDTGKVCGLAVNADLTVAMYLPKFGNVLNPGAMYNGKLILGSIGIFKDIVAKLHVKNNIIDYLAMKEYLPKRLENSHKGTFGTAAVIAGSIGLTGAAILTCKAALNSGVGLIKLFIPESIDTIISSNISEVVTIPLKEGRKGVIGINNISQIIEVIEQANVITVGPGCGNTNELTEILKRIITTVEKTLVIDADGLNALSKNIDVLKDKQAKIILTPHIGEMAKLLDKSISEINENKLEIVKSFSKEYGVILVLKSARTLIGLPNGEVYINTTGNSGMATAGTGDVLTGIITSLIAQGIEPEKAAILGVFIHGHTGDIMAEKKGEYGLVAGDLVNGLSKVLKELSK